MPVHYYLFQKWTVQLSPNLNVTILILVPMKMLQIANQHGVLALSAKFSAITGSSHFLRLCDCQLGSVWVITGPRGKFDNQF